MKNNTTGLIALLLFTLSLFLGTSTWTVAQQGGQATAALQAAANTLLTSGNSELTEIKNNTGQFLGALSVDAEHDTVAATTGPQGMCTGNTSAPTAVGAAGRAARIWCTLLGQLVMTPTPHAAGGADSVKYTAEQVAGDNDDEHAVCTGPCNLYSITCTNHAATVAYIRIENDTAANTTPGSETVELDLAIPGQTTGAGITFSFPVGKFFSNAATAWWSTGEADSDTTDVGANDVKCFYTLKQ